MGFIDCQGPEVVENTCEGCLVWGGPQQPRKPRIFKFKELERATNFFSENNILGKGSHSCVYKAVLNNGDVVAVKRPTLGRRTLEDAMSFDNELDILSRLRHRHLVNLVGFCNEAHEKLLVVEFMENGTLFDLLHSSKEPLSWSARMHMALQAAQAILALHSASPPIIHRDVKSSNVLIDSHWNAKLSDLGLAMRGQLEDVTKKGTPPAGTMGYIDPEYQTPAQLSSKSDVFSFGILLLEIMSGRKAIDVRYNPSSLVDWAVPLIRQGNALDVCDKSIEPPQNIKVVHYLASIAARSVRQSKDRRPTMVEVVDGLQKIRRKLPSPRFGGKRLRALSSPLAAVVPKREVSRESPLRTTIAQTSAPKDEACDYSGEAVSFAKSEVFSNLDEGRSSGEGIVSPSETEQSSSSQVYIRRAWRLVDVAGDGQATLTTSKAISAARVMSSKRESPIFDIHSSSPAKFSTSFRVGMIRNSAGSPLSPLSTPTMQSVNSSPVDKSTPRRPVDSSVFGSQITLRTRDSSSITFQRFATQGVDSGLKWNESALGLQVALERSTMSRSSSLERNSSREGDVQLGSQSSILEQSTRKTLSNRDKDTTGKKLSSNLKVLQNNDTTTRVSRMGGRGNRDAKVDANGGLLLQPRVSIPSSKLKDLQENGTTNGVARLGGSANRDANVDSNGGSILQPTVPFRLDLMPNWGLGIPTTAAKFYSNKEPLFEKVDLPILV